MSFFYDLAIFRKKESSPMLKIRSFGKVTMLSLILLACLPYCLNGCVAKVIQSSARNEPEANAIGYNLPKGLIHLVVKPKQGATNDYEITFAVISVPDENHLYTLKYLPNPTADDTINIQVGSNGLLKSITTTTIDKVPEIVQKIAELVPVAVKSFVPAAQVSQLKLLIKNIDVIFDPDDKKAVGDLKKRFHDEVGADFEVEPLFVAQQYREPLPSPHSVYYRLLVPYRVTLRFTYSTAASSSDETASSSGKAAGTAAKAADNGYYESSQILYIPNRHSPILSCDINRAAFVTKTYTLTFSDGVLISSIIGKPSEVSGFMSIPLDVAKAIVAVPSSIVKFKIDTTTQSTALVEAQNNLIKAQEDRIKALQSLEKTKQSEDNKAP
jgi:hypothetical protein